MKRAAPLLLIPLLALAAWAGGSITGYGSITGDGTGTLYGFTQRVITHTGGSGDHLTLTAADSGSVIINAGAGAQSYVDLPTASAGLNFCVLSPSAHGVRVTAASGDNIVLGEAVSSTAGYVETTTQYSLVCFLAINDTTWGTPTYRNAWSVYDGSNSNRATKIHAEYYILPANSAESAAITATVPLKIAGTATSGHADGFTITTANGGRATYDGGTTKDFLITVAMSMSTTKNGSVVSIFIAKNGSAIAKTEVQRKCANADVGAAALVGEISLATDDYIEIYVTISASTNDTITAEALNVSIVQIPE